MSTGHWRLILGSQRASSRPSFYITVDCLLLSPAVSRGWSSRNGYPTRLMLIPIYGFSHAGS